jgi:hypothetical protein
METIGKRDIRSYLCSTESPKAVTNNQVRQDRGHQVATFLDLAKKIAALQYKNPQFVFLFRGQRTDYKNLKKNTSLNPTLFRSASGGSSIPDAALLEKRFRMLADAERRLVEVYGRQHEFDGTLMLKRQRILRWAILQHYEICRTPLLDVTQSLRVAASFASEDAVDQAFIYVLGVPNISGSLTASAESGLQIVRLSSVCPPVALRPHIQEGYLLGEYPDMPDYDQKQHYKAFEIDFGRRLLGKFSFDPLQLWDDPIFPKIDRPALYPDEHDPMCQIANEIKAALGEQE